MKYVHEFKMSAKLRLERFLPQVTQNSIAAAELGHVAMKIENATLSHFRLRFCNLPIVLFLFLFGKGVKHRQKTKF